ncbi:MAG: hypothetical protein WC683_02170 [bacterium]
MPRPILITDFSCTPTICGPLLSELWPDESVRPVVLSIPVSAAGSDNHQAWVKNYQDAHGGEFLRPFIEEHGADPSGLIGLVGFSAGGWGIGQIIKNTGDSDAVSALYVVDGMHGGWKGAQPSYAERAKGETWRVTKVGQHWLDFASSASRGEKMMIVTHSKILPPTYPGTRETALSLGDSVGAKPIDIDLGIPVAEAIGIGALFILGVYPPDFPPDDKQAHIYQANECQEAVWRTLLAPWARGELVFAKGGGSAKVAAVVGGAIVGFLLHQLWRKAA